MSVLGTVLLASFISPVAPPPKVSVDSLTLSGKAVEQVVEAPNSVDEKHLDYDEMLNITRQILNHPRVKAIYRQELTRQKKDFVAHETTAKKRGLTFDDVSGFNEVTFGNSEKGPSVNLKFVKKFDYRAKTPRVIEYVSYRMHRDEKGEILFDSDHAELENHPQNSASQLAE
jgi:hypothetical protein